MKRLLMTMMLLLALTAGLEAAGQRHRHTPQQGELVDSTSTDAVEVYSDTTSMDTAVASKHRGTISVTTPTSPWSKKTTTYELQDDDLGSFIMHLFGGEYGGELPAILGVLGILFIIFVLSPILIIAALFYFINKNRKQKMKLAQMAVEQGQPIPEHLLEDQVNNVTDEYQKGLRQCFVGVGLMIFLGLVAEEVGFGIGALVFCIGLGKIVAAKTAEKKTDHNQL